MYYMLIARASLSCLILETEWHEFKSHAEGMFFNVKLPVEPPDLSAGPFVINEKLFVIEFMKEKPTIHETPAQTMDRCMKEIAAAFGYEPGAYTLTIDGGRFSISR